MRYNIREMQSLYESGMTLQQVGYRYGITRERVRQLFAREGIARRATGRARTDPSKKVFTCLECRKTKTLKYVPQPNRKFCDRKCLVANWNKESLRHNLSKKEMTAYLSAKAKERYNTRPECKAGRLASKKKYQSTEKYKTWYEGHKQRLKEKRALLRQKSV